MTISQKYLEFISLVQALNTIVFGDDTAEVTLDGITKPSISKFLAQVDALTTAELQRLRDAINVVMNRQSVPTTIVTDGTHSQEWINSDLRAALQALNNRINTKGLPNGYASLDANGTIPKAQLPIDAIPQATETVLGVAKIATSAIAKTGANDTDFITAKKLRDALNASGSAPVSACRAWVTWGFLSNVITIKSSFNVLSVVRVGLGLYDISFTAPMPHGDYCCLGTGSSDAGGSDASNYVVKFPKGHVPTVNTVRVSTNYSAGGGNGACDFQKCCVGVFC